MLRGLWRLTWLEIKIFVREPMGVIGTVGVPVLVFVLLAELLGGGGTDVPLDVPPFFVADLPILAAMLIAASTLLSLVTIIAIYREGGILKRLRATPLRPHTILTAHVLAKLFFTAMTITLMILAGRSYFPLNAGIPLVSFGLALLFSTTTVISLGFLIASIAPTARFAQPIGAVLIYPLLGISGLFVPFESLPPVAQAIARVSPFTYSVSLLRGIWNGAGWTGQLGDVVVLALMLLVFIAVSAKLFRWE